MSGLLVGIMLARTAAGVLAQFGNWRLVFVFAAVVMVVLAVTPRLVLRPVRSPAAAPANASLSGPLAAAGVRRRACHTFRRSARISAAEAGPAFRARNPAGAGPAASEPSDSAGSSV